MEQVGDQNRDRTGTATDTADERDPLTGLLDYDGVARWFDERSKTHPHALMLYFDVDDFQHLTSRHGDTVGDQVLVEITNRLQATLRGDDIIGRVGDDEFLTVSCAPWSDDAAVSTAMRIARELARPMAITRQDGTVESIVVGTSMGTALGPTNDLNALLAHADDNLARAKQRRALTHPFL